MGKRAAHAIGAAAIAVGLLTAVPSAATAEPASAGAVATYQGQRINLLKDGWRGAHTCVVNTPRDIDCYAGGRAADTALGYDRAADPLARELSPAALPACANGWLCLYEHADGKGRRLIFSDEYWHDLNQYGFANKASSWRNNQNKGDNGGLRMGNKHEIWLSAPGYSSSLGAYNDRAQAVHG